ncbi:AI-2E family transporter, partial [Gordonia paraffinivorans]|uniref:AI-2E family transporter n=1 Tax=Gordonia paraffinivorans TaxID=175628 RepID=UPI00242A7DA4
MREAEPAGRPQQVLDLASFDRSKVHPQVRAAAEWAWRILLLLAAAYVAGRLFLRLDEVLVPVALAILISAMLVPVVDAMDRRGVPRSLAVLLNIVLGLGLIAAVMAFVVREFMRGLPQLVEEVEQTIEQTKQWLVEGPLDFDQSQVQNVGSDLLKFLQNNQDKVTSGALATATT